MFPVRVDVRKPVSVIIPYNKDRGWLRDAVASVPDNVQLLLSKGDGNWPENFNKVLDQAEGKYIRWLHEDDMLTPNCIEDSIRTFEEQDADFIHGPSVEIFVTEHRPARRYTPSIKYPTVEDLLHKNVLHSATMMYKREVFVKVGKLDETLNTAEEFEFNLRCLKAGLKIGYCDKPLAYYRRHPQQKVRVVPKEAKDKEREQVRALYK
jgi:GT2 family glycosyltransferase